MAAKKQDKSSKTAHVLNLLTKPAPAAQSAQLDAPGAQPAPAAIQAEAPAPAAAQPTAAAAQPAAAPLVPPVLQNAKAEENLSAQIRGALEEDLAAALSENSANAASEDFSEDFAEAYFEAYDDLTEGVGEIIAAPAPEATPEPEPAPVAYTPVAHKPQQSNLLYLNIMQPLVEAAAPRYTKMFNVCTCPRCQADVRAYAMTHLKPHYAVYRQEDSIPMLTLYETRYASEVATILTKACEVVNENPRHRYRY